MPYYEQFARLLCDREKTIYQVSNETGIPYTALADWKSGRSKPKLDKLKAISEYFNVPIEYFTECPQVV